MSESTLPLEGTVESADVSVESRSYETWIRMARFTSLRLLALFATVVVGVYLTIMVANMGGYVDEIRRGQIREQIAVQVTLSDEMRQLSPEERAEIIEEQARLAEQRLGLDRPFILRSFGYLGNALTLNLGQSEQLISDSGSKQVRNIILERLPATLVLFATAQLLLFFMGIFFALSLSRSYGTFMDRFLVGLAPTSAAPAWFYGIFLILIFAALLRVLPYGGMVSAPPPESPLLYGLSLLEHMILPVAAWLMGGLFLAIYQWRTFFLIYSSEDYVEMAKAKGLPDKMIERRYVLRPTLPNIVTSFALLLITLWSGAIIHETVFNWPGLGRLYFQAIGLFDTPVIVANAVIYAYLLAITVFLLDFIYALVDPRVRVGEGGRK